MENGAGSITAMLLSEKLRFLECFVTIIVVASTSFKYEKFFIGKEDDLS